MAKYFAFAGTWKIAETSALSELLSSRVLSKIESADIVETASFSQEVADAEVDTVIPLGPLTTCLALLVISDRKISIKIDNEPVVLGHTDGESSMLILPACSFTSLKVSNASGATANIYVSMGGT